MLCRFSLVKLSSTGLLLAVMIAASSPVEAFREQAGKNCYRDCQMKCDGPLGVCTSRKKVCGETMCSRQSPQGSNPSVKQRELERQQADAERRRQEQQRAAAESQRPQRPQGPNPSVKQRESERQQADAERRRQEEQLAGTERQRFPPPSQGSNPSVKQRESERQQAEAEQRRQEQQRAEVERQQREDQRKVAEKAVDGRSRDSNSQASRASATAAAGSRTVPTSTIGGVAGQPPWLHNGSQMKLTASGDRVEFVYERPRQGLGDLSINSGTLLFSGIRNGKTWTGEATTFSRQCGVRKFAVNGTETSDSSRVELRGQRPNVDSTCTISGYRDEVLLFELGRTTSR